MSMMGGGADLGTATFYITGNAQGASNAAAQANNSLAQLEGTVAQNWWGVRNLGLAFAALPAAVGAGVVAAVNATRKWQDAMVDVARTTNLSGDALDALEQDLLRIGRTRAVPTVEIAGVAEAAGALGVAQEDIADFTQTVVDMSQTTDVTSQAAATGLARLAGLTNVTAGGFDNLSSSVMNAGVQTAATESEILGLAQRLAGIGGALGLNAQQVIGWAAAVLSAGIKTQMGATAIQRTFIDMANAVAEGGDELEGWATIAGMSGEQLRAAFRNDANAALLTVIEGLARLNAEGGDTIAMLNRVGVTEARQVQTLLLLARAQEQNNNENLKASKILEIAEEGFRNTERMQAAVEARTRTLNGQLRILSNTFFSAGTSVGKSFLAPLTASVGVITTFASGLDAIPTPLRAVIGLTVGMSAVLLGLAAALLIIGPRAVIAYGAMRQLQAGVTGAGAAVGSLTSQTSRGTLEQQRFSVQLAATNRRLIEQQQNALAVANAFGIMSGQGATGSQILSTYNANAAVAANRTSSLSMWLGRLSQVARFAGAALIGLTVYTYALGRAQQRLEADTRRRQQADDELTAAMRRQGQAAGEQTSRWLQQNATYQRVSESARQLGVDQEKLNSVIQGTASSQDWQEVLDQSTRAQGKNSEAAKKLIQDTYDLRQQWKNSQGDAGVVTDRLKDQTAAMKGLGEETAMTKEQFEKFRKLQEQIAQATVDLIDAQLAARAAQFDLADSLEDLNEAKARAAGWSTELQKAEADLTRARLDQKRTQREVAKAEMALARAREDAAHKTAEAEDSLLDAQDRLLDSEEKVRDTEEKLAKLREGTSADDFRDATNKLADAHLRLRGATADVTDLEQHLQYLREQGAGHRDIARAELALDEARQDVANATDDIADAEKELNDLTDPVARARAISAAERDLASARRDVLEAARNIQERERALADARADQANDTAHKEAEQELVDARLRNEDAARKIQEAELALARARADGGRSAIAEAELAYEQALLRSASANAEVRRQTALMNGETWDAGRSARALAEELGKVAVATDAARQRREEWLAVLRKAPNVPQEQEGAEALAGDEGDIPVPPGADEGIALPKGITETAKTSMKDVLLGVGSTGAAFMLAEMGAALLRGLKRKVFGKAAEEAVSAGTKTMLRGGFLSRIGPILLSGLGTAVTAFAGFFTAVFTALAALVPLLIAALPYIIVGLLIAGIIAFLWKSGIGEKIIGAIVDLLKSAVDFFADNWKSLLVGFLFGPFAGIAALMGVSGGEIIDGLWNGIKAAFRAIGDFGKWLWENLVKPVMRWLGIASPSTVFVGIGGDIIRGLQEGVKAVWSGFFDFFSGLPGKIIGAFTNGGKWLFSKGGEITQGLWNGLSSIWDKAWAWLKTLPEKIGGLFNIFGNPLRVLHSAGESLITGLWNGIKAAWDKAWDWIQRNILDKVKDAPVISWVMGSPSRLYAGYGKNLILGLTKGMNGQKRLLANTVEDVMKTAEFDVSSLARYNLGHLIDDSSVPAYVRSPAGMPTGSGAVTNNYYEENLNLEAITTADPAEIMSEYVFTKRIRTRG